MRLLATLATLSLILGACDDDDGLAETVTTTSSTTTTTEARESEATKPPSRDTAEEQPSSADPQAIVLKLEDLPTGWSPTPPDEEEEEDDSIDCFQEASGTNFDDMADAEAEFQQGDFGPFISSTIVVTNDDDEADGLIDSLSAGFEACDGFVETDEDGTETTYTVAPLSFPKMADRTFASRLSATTSFGPLLIDIVASRSEALVIFTAHVGFGGVDSGLTEQAQRVQVDRAG